MLCADPEAVTERFHSLYDYLHPDRDLPHGPVTSSRVAVLAVAFDLFPDVANSIFRLLDPVAKEESLPTAGGAEQSPAQLCASLHQSESTAES